MTFEEACSAVADLFEAIPETWADRVAKTEEGLPTHYADPLAASWCLGGALAACWGTPEHRFDAIARQLGYPGPVTANNRGGRLVAIKMLRMAAGEIK